jgi:hypothetical protein
MAATFDRPSVTTELARAMIEAAERKASEMGNAFVIAIVDDSGVLKAFSRMDGAALVSRLPRTRPIPRSASACPPTRGMTSLRTIRRSPWARLLGSIA